MRSENKAQHSSTAPVTETQQQQLTRNTKNKKKRGLPNLIVRAITIILLAPAVLISGFRSRFVTMLIVLFGLFVGGIEWFGLKRHLKVALLLWGGGSSSSNGGSGGGDVVAPERPASPLEPKEYPLPIVPVGLYGALKAGGWAATGIAASYSDQAWMAVFVLYFLIFVTVTVVAHNRLERKIDGAVRRLGSDDDGVRAETGEGEGGRGDDDPAALRARQRQHFLSLELVMFAEKQPTVQFLDFSLDIFGLLWLSGFSMPLLCYDAPIIGKPWIVATMVGNFANDIFALLVGRALRLLRERFAGTPNPGRALSLLLRGPHPLYPTISPNKSVEGAVAGVVANSVVFAATLALFFDTGLWPAPLPSVVAPFFFSKSFFLLEGLLMGVLGVIGDLLQSLLKRVARVKDAGFIIPGHGGVLDRMDGMILAFYFMYVSLHFIMSVSASLSTL